jgi:hypothetical protein
MQTNLLYCPLCESPVETRGGAYGAGGTWHKCSNPFCGAKGSDDTWIPAKAIGRGSRADRLTGRERQVLSTALYREVLKIGGTTDNAYNIATFADAIANTAADYLGFMQQAYELVTVSSDDPAHLNDSLARIMDDFEEVQFEEFLEPDPTPEETNTEGSD